MTYPTIENNYILYNLYIRQLLGILIRYTWKVLNSIEDLMYVRHVCTYN